MTKQDVVDAVAQKTGMTKKDAGDAVEAVLDVVTGALTGGRLGDVHRVRQVLHLPACRASGREPAHRREGVDQRRDRAQVLGRQQPQEGSQHLATPSLDGGASAGGRPRRSGGPWLLEPSHRVTGNSSEDMRGGRHGPFAVQARGEGGFSDLDYTNICSYSRRMQLSFDAADRLVELVEARGGAIAGRRGRAHALRAASAPGALARSLLDDVVGGGRAPLVARRAVALARPPALDRRSRTRIGSSFDLETTGLRRRHRGSARSARSGSAALEPRTTFDTLVDPRVPLPVAVQALTGIAPRELRSAPPVELAVRRFLAFAGEAVLVAHNARFDMAFLDREVERLTGRRIAAPVVDTVWLARGCCEERTRRVGLASLAHFFGTSVEPCHRALPDAQATAEILVRLLGLAQERGARTVGDVVELAAPRARRLQGEAVAGRAAPRRRPASYLFRDWSEQVLYVGRARDLRTRLRSYFAGGRQRPAVEAALAALARVEWRETGSELEAALEELRADPRAPAAGERARQGRRRDVAAAARQDWSVVTAPSEHGPIAARRSPAAPRARSTAATATTRRRRCPRCAAGSGGWRETQRFEDAAQAA